MLFCSRNMNYKNFVTQSSLFHILVSKLLTVICTYSAIEYLIYKYETIYIK